VNFAEWQGLAPEAAAREVLRRASERLSPAQRRAAIASLAGEEALALSLAAAPAAAPLRGVPYLLKDLFDVAGQPTFAGSTFLPKVRPAPTADGALVRDLRAAGAALAGKTQLFEFAWGLTGENAHYGDCEKPGHEGRTSGGSSSGSAAAVAAGIVPLAVGTDTGGSVRVPAAFCGVFGYRGVPGDAWISDAVALAPSFDTAGWFTSCAPDMLRVLDALVGPERGGREPRGCYLELPGVDADVASACREAALGFATEADQATRAELTARFEPAAETYGVLAGVESWRIHRKWAVRHRADYGPLVQARLDRARAVSQAQVAAVEPSQASLRSAWVQFFKAWDFLVMPATPFAALSKSDCTPANRLRMLALTTPVSLAGLPALAIPVPLPTGLSAGLQVVFPNPKSPAMAWILGRCRQSSG
jgi:aspartyl-tRNA(Asn)/glutamyl-tRNA(Gln) amidotransferase subunit A